MELMRFDRDDRWSSGDSLKAWLDRGRAGLSTNVRESDTEYVVEIPVPGMDKKDLQVLVDQNRLIIKGEYKNEQENQGEHFYRREFSCESFERSFVLPEDVDVNQVKAECKDGLLCIHLNRMPHRASDQEIPVQASESKDIPVQDENEGWFKRGQDSITDLFK